MIFSQLILPRLSKEMLFKTETTKFQTKQNPTSVNISIYGFTPFKLQIKALLWGCLMVNETWFNWQMQVLDY